VCHYSSPSFVRPAGPQDLRKPDKHHASAKIQIGCTSGASSVFHLAKHRELGGPPWKQLFSTLSRFSKSRESNFAQPTSLPPRPMSYTFGKKPGKSKPPKPSQKHIHLGIPINIAVGPLGFRAELDTDPKGDRNRSYRDSEPQIDGSNR